MSSYGPTVLYNGQLKINYAQFYLDGTNDEASNPDYEKAFEGHKNGICGAGQPGRLFLISGIQSGAINIKVELHDQEPRVQEEYADIVEVSLAIDSKSNFLCDWECETMFNLGLPPDGYRVRYSIKNFDLEFGGDIESPPQGQTYLLQFWPNKKREGHDEIIRANTNASRYWHNQDRQKNLPINLQSEGTEAVIKNYPLDAKFPDIYRYLYFGRNKKEIKPFTISFRNMGWSSEEDAFLGTVCLEGIEEISFSKKRQDWSCFHFLVTNMAGLRQVLRQYQENAPEIKFYEEIGGTIIEQTLEDIFWVHDCR